MVIGTWALVVIGAAALWYARGQIMESHDQARIQHLNELVQQFDESPRMIEARRNLARSRIDEQHESLRPMRPDDPPDDIYTLLNFFEHMGLLERRGYLDKQDVWDEFGFYLFAFNADAQPVIAEDQKTEGAAVWENFTHMMSALQEVDTQRNREYESHTAQADVYDLYDGERTAQSGQPVPQGKRRKSK